MFCAWIDFLLSLSPLFFQVGSNGVISFGAPYFLNFPTFFPGVFSDQVTAYVVAPFWGDVDARMDGHIFYEVHEAGLTDASDAYLKEVSAFISSTSRVNFKASYYHTLMALQSLIASKL